MIVDVLRVVFDGVFSEEGMIRMVVANLDQRHVNVMQFCQRWKEKNQGLQLSKVTGIGF